MDKRLQRRHKPPLIIVIPDREARAALRPRRSRHYDKD
jgi:hypothetical protein